MLAEVEQLLGGPKLYSGTDEDQEDAVGSLFGVLDNMQLCALTQYLQTPVASMVPVT